MSIYQSFHLFTPIGKRAFGLQLKGLLVTARKRNLGKGNIFKPVVSHSVHMGVSAPLHAWIHTPWADTPQAGGMYPTLMHTFVLVLINALRYQFILWIVKLVQILIQNFI